MDIAAKGGFLYAQAMEESSYYEEENVIGGHCVRLKEIYQNI